MASGEWRRRGAARRSVHGDGALLGMGIRLLYRLGPGGRGFVRGTITWGHSTLLSCSEPLSAWMTGRALVTWTCWLRAASGVFLVLLDFRSIGLVGAFSFLLLLFPCSRLLRLATVIGQGDARGACQISGFHLPYQCVVTVMIQQPTSQNHNYLSRKKEEKNHNYLFLFLRRQLLFLPNMVSH